MQEHAFRPRDASFFLIDFDTLSERSEMIAAVSQSDVIMSGIVDSGR